MTEVLVLVAKGTGLVVAGLTRKSGGALPSAAALVGFGLSVKFASATQRFDFATSDLEVRMVPNAVQSEVVTCAGKTIEGEGDQTRFATATTTLTAAYNAGSLTVTGPFSGSLSLISATGGIAMRDHRLEVVGGASPTIAIAGAPAGPVVVTAPGYAPVFLP